MGRLIANAPKNGWAWWIRVKHAATWDYFLMDATGDQADPGFCTDPNDGTGTVQRRPCQP